MKRRRFLGRSVAAGMALTGAKALRPAIAAPATQAQPANLPSKFIPMAYASRRSEYSPFATSDYYTFADDLVVERNRPGKPHQGKVLAAVQPHSDDVPMYCGGTVAKLIDEGYTGYLIRISNDEAAGKTLGYGVVQNEIDNHAVAKALGRAVEAAQGKRLALLGNDDRAADREHVRRFLLGDSGEYGKEHNLRYAERFYYTDQRPSAKAEVDEYVEKNAVSI